MVVIHRTDYPFEHRGFIKIIRIAVISFRSISFFLAQKNPSYFSSHKSMVSYQEKDFKRLSRLLERLKQTNDPFQFLTEINWAHSVFGSQENDHLASELNQLANKSSIEIVTSPKMQLLNYGKDQLTMKSNLNGITTEFSLNEKSQEILGKIDSLSFNVLDLHQETSGDELACVMVTIFEKMELLQELKASRNDLIKLSRFISLSYNDNPYHNPSHATDITQVWSFSTISLGVLIVWPIRQPISF